MSTLHDQTLPDKQITPSAPLPLWRNRDFLLLISGQGISSIGSQVSLIAFPLLLLALTHSIAQTGFITALRTLPSVFLCLPAGALIDRWNRKLVMIVCDLGRALALGSIPVAILLGQLTYVQLYLVALIEGTLFIFFSIAEYSCLPHVVAKSQLSAAAGQNEAVFSLASMIGPALAPILYAVSRLLPFLADAISYGVSALSLFFIRADFQEQRKASNSNLRTEVKEGMVWLWKHTTIRLIALLTFGLITPCYGFVLVLLALGQKMHASDVMLSYIFACSGVGSIVGALIASPLCHRFGFARVIIVSTWVWALSWLFYALAPDPISLGIVNALSFIVVPVYMVVQYSYRLAAVPDHLQGRVNSVFRLIAFGGQPLGIALTGLLIQLVGPVWAVVVLFIPQGLLALAVTFSKGVRAAPHIDEV